MITIEKIINSDEEMSIDFVEGVIIGYSGKLNGHDINVIVESSEESEIIFNKKEKLSILLHSDGLHRVEYTDSIKLQHEDLKTMMFSFERWHLDGKCTIIGHHYGLQCRLQCKVKCMDNIVNRPYYSYDYIKDFVNIKIKDNSTYGI